MTHYRVLYHQRSSWALPEKCHEPEAGFACGWWERPVGAALVCAACLAPEIRGATEMVPLADTQVACGLGNEPESSAFEESSSTVSERRESLGVIDNQSHHSLQRRFAV